tara:strand:+ start:421 stop:822 length:402 start_codon:yes stop_codon:yes gene_type:complete
MEDKEDINIKNAATILLLSVANADYRIEKEELKLTKEIIEDFFSIDKKEAYIVVENAINELKQSTSFFEYGQILNENFTYQDKIDFIFCVFEVAYVDKELHFMEQHLIKKIAGILNVEHQDLIKTKLEIKKYL